MSPCDGMSQLTFDLSAGRHCSWELMKWPGTRKAH